MPDHLPTLGYEIESGSGTLPKDVRVHRFAMSEAVSEPYTITAVVVTTELDYAFEKLLGHDLCINLAREGQVRSVYGVVSEVDWLGVSGEHLMLRLIARPALALLDQQVQSRMFQDLSALDIVDAILSEQLPGYGREHDLGAVSRGKSAREYCTQYRESNLAFVTRLLEEEGISYAFEHGEDAEVERLVLIDAPKQIEASTNLDGSSRFPLIAHNPSEADVESIQSLDWRGRSTTTGVMRRDFDWQSPTELLDAEDDEPDERDRSRRIYTHGARRFVEDDLADRVADLRAAHALRGRRGLGRSNVSGFHAGQTFELDGHSFEGMPAELLLVRVEHDGYDPGALPSIEGQGDGEIGYENSFECVPADVELRPIPLSPRPEVDGPQTAVVTGPSGEEIHVDEHGRVAVQFYWDETPAWNDTTSCWIRVAQRWAGAGWGAQFIPRVGMEVVVSFLEGNPDRPLITGCVYDGANAPTYPVPDAKTQSGIESSSSPGGDGSNELRFEDAAGSEDIYLHAQRDAKLAVENDKRQTVGHDESLEVGNDRTFTIKHDETVTIDNDAIATVGHDLGQTIDNDMTLSVTGNRAIIVGKDHGETIGNNRTRTISTGAVEAVGETKAVKVGAVMQATVGGLLNLSAGGAAAIEIGAAVATAVGGQLSEHALGGKTLDVGERLDIDVKEAGQLATGKAMTITGKDTVTVTSQKGLALVGEGKGLLDAADEITFKCGSASIVLDKGGTITISGATIEIEGSGPINVKGSKVDNN